MTVMQRARGLLLSPRRTWDAIAAEGDSTRFLLTRYVPILALGAIAIELLWRWFLESPVPQQSEVFIRRPDGSLVAIGTRQSVSMPTIQLAWLLVPLYVAQTALGIYAMRALILMNAPRFAAAADRVAATKLAAYAPTPAWLGVALLFVPLVGPVLAVLAWAYSIYLVHVGAPRLLPPHPDEHGRFGRAMAIRAILVCLGLTVLTAIAILVVAPSILPPPR